MMHDIEVDVPVRTVYDQWTQFEDFPLFMEHVIDVRQLDDTHTEWTAKISGVKRSWKAEITEQTPDQRVAWTSSDGTKHSGVVTFHALSDDRTKVVLQFEMDPEGFLEHVADWGGYISDRTKKDLDRFKDFVESRGKATGSWRGTVERDSMRDLHERERKLVRAERCPAGRAGRGRRHRAAHRPRARLVGERAGPQRGRHEPLIGR